MISEISKRRTTSSYRILSAFIAIAFIFSLIVPPTPLSAQVVSPALLDLPLPGAMISLSPSFNPPIIQGVTINPENPLKFNFLISSGDHNLEGDSFRNESTKLIKYFLAGLTVPDEELWVNLSPYEKDRVIPGKFGQTEMGRDMLAQDYILKQLTASLMYPENELGKKFWDRVYQKAYERYGTTEIPMNTFNKIWIVPDKAVVYEHGQTAFVVESHLKVMLEEDYVALKNNLDNTTHDALGSLTKGDAEIMSGVSSEIVREILIPEIEKEVNGGEIFTQLRQIYNSVILAVWYKKNLRESLLGQVYVDKGKTKGVDFEDKEANEKIYQRYVEAFEKGVYNYIKEDYDPVTQGIIPRKYFSGGNNLSTTERVLKIKTTIEPNQLPPSSSPIRNVQADLLESSRNNVAYADNFKPTESVDPSSSPVESRPLAQRSSASPVIGSDQAAVTVTEEDFQEIVQLRSEGKAGFHKNIDPTTRAIPAQDGVVLNWLALPFDKQEQLKAEEARMYREGKITMIVMAGGEATRFGGPKTFVKVSDDLGEFLEIKAANLRWVHETFGTDVPMYLLSSEKRLPEFKQALAERNYYGLSPEDFLWYTQGTIDTFIPTDEEIEANFKGDAVTKHKAYAAALRKANPDGIYRINGQRRKVPSGHFDAIASFIISGRLTDALERGIEYAPVVNIDNLKAILKNKGLIAHFAESGNDFGFILAEKNMTATVQVKSTGKILVDKLIVRFVDNIISFDGITEFYDKAEKDGIQYVINQNQKTVDAYSIATEEKIDVNVSLKAETGGTLVQLIDGQGRPVGKPVMKEGFELNKDFPHERAPYFNTNTIIVNLRHLLGFLGVTQQQLAGMNFEERSELVRNKLVKQIKPNFEFKNDVVDGAYPEFGVVENGRTKIAVSQLTRIMLQVAHLEGANVNYYTNRRSAIFAPVKEPEDMRVAAANNRSSLRQYTVYKSPSGSSSSPVETPQYGIQKQRNALAKALESPEKNYYDAVFLVVDEQSYVETQNLVRDLRGSTIPEGANIIVVRQLKGKIKGNWSALINILMDSEHWGQIDKGLYSNMAVILSAGTGSRNYPLTATGYGDKGKQAAPNGRTYIEQQFKQIMQYYEQDHKGMVIVSNDGIKSLSKEITLGEQGVQFMGSQLPILSSQLDGFGTADVEPSETVGKPIRAFNEKATLINRIMAYYHVATASEAEKVIKDIQSGELEEKLIPTNWADYNLTLKALSEIHTTYGELRDIKGQLLYLKYGLDTGGDLFESTTIEEDVYVAGKVKKGWAEDDARRLWDTATALRKKFGFGYVSTGISAIFFDTGSNQTYAEVTQQLLTNKDLRDLLDIPEPTKGSIIGPNVVFGRGVKVEKGVVALGTVVINKGHLKSGAVVINSALKELYAEGGSLTYNVEELEDPVYVNKGYLVSDVFFKRKMRLVPKNIQRGNQKLFTLITVDSHLEMGHPRVIGGVVIENGEIIEKPTGIDFEIPQKGDEVVDQAKIRVNMPLYLSAKDTIREYDLMSKDNKVFAHIIAVNGIVRGYFPLDKGVENLEALENVIGNIIKHDLTIVSKDDLLYNVKPIGNEVNFWELKNLPRKITNENQPVSPRLEARENRVSFAELAHWADSEGTSEFSKVRLPGYLGLKKVAALPKTSASSPIDSQYMNQVRQAVEDLRAGMADFSVLARLLKQGAILAPINAWVDLPRDTILSVPDNTTGRAQLYLVNKIKGDGVYVLASSGRERIFDLKNLIGIASYMTIPAVDRLLSSPVAPDTQKENVDKLKMDAASSPVEHPVSPEVASKADQIQQFMATRPNAMAIIRHMKRNGAIVVAESPRREWLLLLARNDDPSIFDKDWQEMISIMPEIQKIVLGRNSGFDFVSNASVLFDGKSVQAMGLVSQSEYSDKASYERVMVQFTQILGEVFGEKRIGEFRQYGREELSLREGADIWVEAGRYAYRAWTLGGQLFVQRHLDRNGAKMSEDEKEPVLNRPLSWFNDKDNRIVVGTRIQENAYRVVDKDLSPEHFSLRVEQRPEGDVLVIEDLWSKGGTGIYYWKEQAVISSSPVEEEVAIGQNQLNTDFTKGGIDFNPALLDLQIKRDGNGVALPMSLQPIEVMNIEGFLPVIINITPVLNLPMLLGLDTSGEEDPSGAASADSAGALPADELSLMSGRWSSRIPIGETKFGVEKIAFGDNLLRFSAPINRYPFLRGQKKGPEGVRTARALRLARLTELKKYSFN